MQGGRIRSWANSLGAAQLRRDSPVTYEQYVDQGAVPLLDVAQTHYNRQITDDVRRLHRDQMAQESMTTLLDYTEKQDEAIRASVQRVLRAFVQRGHSYALGVHKVGLFLTVQLDTEEEAFWMLVAITSRVLPSDFYCRPPASINGFHADCRVITKLAPRLFPRMLRCAGSEDELCGTVEMLCQRFLLPLFVDTLDLSATQVVWDLLCSSADGPPAGCLVVVMLALLHLLDTQLDQFDCDEVPMFQWMVEQCKLMHGAEIQGAIERVMAHLCTERVESMRESSRAELAARWSRDNSQLEVLAKHTHFDSGKLEQLREHFNKACTLKSGKRTCFISLATFRGVVNSGITLGIGAVDVDILFNTVDTEQTGEIDFRALCCLISVLCDGTLEERLKLCFEVYDTKRSGVLTQHDLEAMLGTLLQLADCFETPMSSPVSDAQASFLSVGSSPEVQHGTLQVGPELRLEPEREARDALLSKVAMLQPAHGMGFVSFEQFYEAVQSHAELCQWFAYGVLAGHASRHASLSQWGAALALEAAECGSQASGSTGEMLSSDLFGVEPLAGSAPEEPAPRSLGPAVMLGAAALLWGGGSALFWCLLSRTLAQHCDQDCNHPLLLWKAAVAVAGAQLVVAVGVGWLELWGCWRKRGVLMGLAVLSVGANELASRSDVSQPGLMALLAAVSAPAGLLCLLSSQAEPRGVHCLFGQLVLAGLACLGAAGAVGAAQGLELDKLGLGVTSSTMQLIGAAGLELCSWEPQSQHGPPDSCSSSLMVLLGCWTPWLTLLVLPLQHGLCHTMVQPNDCAHTATLVLTAAGVWLLTAAPPSHCTQTRWMVLLGCTAGSLLWGGVLLADQLNATRGVLALLAGTATASCVLVVLGATHSKKVVLEAVSRLLGLVAVWDLYENCNDELKPAYLYGCSTVGSVLILGTTFIWFHPDSNPAQHTPIDSKREPLRANELV